MKSNFFQQLHMALKGSGAGSAAATAVRSRLPSSNSADSLPAQFRQLSVNNKSLSSSSAKSFARPSDSKKYEKINSRPKELSAVIPRNSFIQPKRNFSTNSSCSTMADVAQLILSKKVSKIVIMAGAGISTASGIPDFRTPGTGLYDNLKQFKIPYPEAIFDLDFFSINPKPFFTLAKELYPKGQYKPNLVHYFYRLLSDKGLLLKLYTQNIDGLERLAGIPVTKLVESHGTFATATCTNCNRHVASSEIRPLILQGAVTYCNKVGNAHKCFGILKPDIVFFGEELPPKFWSYLRDFSQADLLIVMGTSLEVEPFAGIVNSTRLQVPRLLINRELVGPFKGKKKRPNDVGISGDLQEQIKEFANLLGWGEELNTLAKDMVVKLSENSDPFASVTVHNNNNNNNKSNRYMSTSTVTRNTRLPPVNQTTNNKKNRVVTKPPLPSFQRRRRPVTSSSSEESSETSSSDSST